MSLQRTSPLPKSLALSTAPAAPSVGSKHPPLLVDPNKPTPLEPFVFKTRVPALPETPIVA